MRFLKKIETCSVIWTGFFVNNLNYLLLLEKKKIMFFINIRLPIFVDSKSTVRQNDSRG
jgi:hypothetical protein